MMKLILLNILCISVHFINSFELENGSFCSGKNATSRPVLEFCKSSGGTMLDRCCRWYDNDTFIAIDLMDANLTAVPDFTFFENFNLSVIDLRSNPDLETSHDDDFLTLTYLDNLILPNTTECPGGRRVWRTIEPIDDPPGHRCENQIDICVNSTDLCVEPGALCSANGPNHFLCLCKPDYYGYKCLRYGTFPMTAFFVPTLAVTLVASILLYLTQRRHIKKRV